MKPTKHPAMHKDLPGHFLLYQTEDGKQRIECRLNQETLWLSLNQIAALFDRDKSVISKHLKKIFDEGELARESVVARNATTAADGKTYQVEYFRLEAVLAVGFRVRSPRGTQFRQWATAQLQEFLTQGFIMDDERMKNPDQSVYFERVLERIRDIRSSEKVFWRKVCDIYATSIDYDPKAETSEKFFATIQNKMHWAAHGQTAAEIIFNRVDATKPNMGVTHFAGISPRKSEVTIGKNYLNAEELETLNRIVTAYLEFAELRAKRREPMRMADWIAKLDDFLRLSDYEVLAHAGKITAEQARLKAESEYHDYRMLIDQQPSEVDKHLADTIRKLDRIESKPDT
jgi:hypothetical protein